MTGSNERVQEALAAHLEASEMGGPTPDTSHLTPEELAELHELIALLDDTEGIAFGSSEPADLGRVTSTEAGGRVVEALRDVIPMGARLAIDPAASSLGFDGVDVAEGWIIGTFGGRVRVWLLAEAGALSRSDAWFRDLERAFRLFGDTVAIALVEPDLSALLVQPEDCSPKIEVPRGSIVGRRYRRPVAPVAEALSMFLSELIPYWEPMQDITHTGAAIDVAPIARERAAQAIESQITSGKRARMEPKKKALTELTDAHAAEVAVLLVKLHEGRADVADVESELRRLAQRP